MKNLKALGAIILGLMVLALAACGEPEPSNASKTAEKEVAKVEGTREKVYVPRNKVEYNNYNAAQKLYDSPATIIWCTTTWGNPSAPMVTVPIAGKLTSSSVSYFPNKGHDSNSVGTWEYERKSVDGMYHGSPGPYRYGFTPAGQYVDFTGMPTFCTTSLTKFQREKTTIDVEIDQSANTATKDAEAILKAGTGKNGKISQEARQKAQAALVGVGR